MRVGVDVGGTFTDLVALGVDGDLEVRKVMTTPEDPAVGMFRALELFDGGRHGPPVDLLVHGTTIATNALLERTGARMVLVTTRGFEDLLWLRRQDRAALYDLARDHPPPLVARGDVVGVAERMGAAGAVEPLGDAEVARVVAAVRELAPETVAVAFLFAFRHPEHERRGATGLRIMSSAGGTLAPRAAACRAAALALSGPAGGVVGARLVGAAVGLSELVTLDMGGTSADASLVTEGAAVSDGAGAVAGVPLALPSILIETVSAGGGSVARMDEGGALKVGPDSAGAVPGPACYGRGGVRPTVTDACLVLGWLDTESPLADAVRLDRGAAERAVASLGPAGGEPARAAAGVVTVAAAVMARALKRVSVARGLDPRRMALLPF